MWRKIFPLIFEQYLAKHIYISFAFVLLSLVSLFVFFDFIAELNFTNENYTNILAFLSVLFRIPNRMVEVMPIAALIAGIYTFASLAYQSEFTIFRVGGLSISLALITVIKIAIPIGLTLLILNESIGPWAEGVGKNIRLDTLNNSNETMQLRSGTWIRDAIDDSQLKSGTGNRYINIGNIETNGRIRELRIFEFDNSYLLLTSIHAQSATYKSNGLWLLQDVRISIFNEKFSANQPYSDFQIKIEKKQNHELQTQIDPQLLNALLIKPERLSIIDLYSYISHLKRNNQDYQRYAVWFWKKIIYPFAVLVMLVLALPFGYLQTRSGSLGFKVFGGIMLGISFQLFNSLFSHIGILGDWPSWISAFIPTFLYLFLAVIGIRTISKV